MRLSHTLTLITLLVFAVNGSAQIQPCGANDLTKVLANHPDPAGELALIAAADAELEQFTSAWAAAQTGAERVVHTIPVVFHIIHNNGPENISDEQVIDAVRILNEDFNRLNPDWDNVRPEFLPIVADVGISFKLATRDPSGNCTNGITRTVSPLTNDGTQAMKNLIQWPRSKYLNIWVAASADGAAGYTYRPGSVNNQPTWDGIVILHTYTGSIGTGTPSRSRALTHEVGHWINLAHTWGNSNNPGLPENCNGDDGVSDTPNTIGWTNCTLSGTSCGSLDNVENYMEYSYCCKMFTEGQKTRMLAALNSGTAQRNQLITAANLAATGVDDEPVLCQASFQSSAGLICAGSAVTFTDLSFHGVTGRQWSFPGGTPSSMEDEAAPSVVYNEPGVYPVQLTVTDGTNTLSSTVQGMVTVLANPGSTPPVSEGFEDLTALNGPDWFAVNPNADNTFTVSTTAAYSGSKSVRISNSSAMAGNVDELLSRTFDMSAAEDISITFRWAYARRTSTSDDVLSLYISNNCGETWSLRRISRGSTTLPTAPATTGGFVPNGPGQWGFAEVTNISATSHIPDFRFKFVFESDGGNHLYLDDININGLPVGLEESLLGAGAALQVLPNPAQGMARVHLNLPTPGHTRLSIIDATGRTMQLEELGLRPAGEAIVPLDLGAMAPGAYAAELSVDGRRSFARFIVE
ncbi:MAG: M43 family zinc metalloprotease [Flavobacteriales bacterium]|jgi:PKD repeat protein|nr:MAG: M43 family zinc metalloprotease [Flavobacteriales bacterium]